VNSMRDYVMDPDRAHQVEKIFSSMHDRIHVITHRIHVIRGGFP
jgi:hypothetical protein